MSKKSKHKKSKVKIDTSITYQVPLISKSNPCDFRYMKLTTTNIEIDKQLVSVKLDGYYPITFSKTFFVRLMNEGKVIANIMKEDL